MTNVAQELAKTAFTGDAAEKVVRMTGGERNSPMTNPVNPMMEIAHTAKNCKLTQTSEKQDLSRFGPHD